MSDLLKQKIMGNYDEEKHILSVIQKPHLCPSCGSDHIYEIVYGEPLCTPEEYYRKFGKHVVFGGCCILDTDIPTYACAECGLKIFKIPFPSKKKCDELALEAARNCCPSVTDVQYQVLYGGRRLYKAIVQDCNPALDAPANIYVDRYGNTEIETYEDINQAVLGNN